MKATAGTLTAVSIVSVIAGLGLLGCGSSSSAEPTNKAQVVQEANSICEGAAAKRSEALEKAADGDPQIAQLAVDALQPVEEMTEELGELVVPAGERDEIRAIVSAFEASIRKVRAEPGDPTAAIAAFAEPNQLAEEYGLTDCTI